MPQNTLGEIFLIRQLSHTMRGMSDAPLAPGQLPTKQVIAHTSLRAHRVVLLVPGAHDWKLMARQAISVITSYWAGAGFVVVPVASDEVHPALVAALRAYDPDMVVVPPADSPLVVASEDREALHAAQEAISAACADYRIPTTEASAYVQPDFSALVEPYLSESGMIPLTPMSLIVDASDSEPTNGARADLGGALGLAAAARWGLTDWPTGEDTDTDSQLQGRAVWRLASYDRSSLGLRGVTTSDQAEGATKTDFERTLYGLMSVYESGLSETPAALIVWGDEPADFALAMAWDRTYGYGIWIADEWWQQDNLRNQISSAIDTLAGRTVGTSRRRIVFTSTSLSTEELERRLQECRQRAGVFLVDIPQNASRQPKIVSAQDIIFPRFNKTHYAIQRRFSNYWSTAVRDDHGTIDFLMLPPVFDIGLPELQSIEDRAHWQVDLAVQGYSLPNTIAVPDDELLAEGQSKFDTRIRSSRSGISFASERTGFVPAEATVQQRLARPMIRYPSLLKWADVRAKVHGMSTRLSAAGAHAQLLATMLGDRLALAELLSRPLLPALQAFNATGATRDTFPDGGGCVVNGEGFQTFEGICAKAGMNPAAEARDTVDRLLQAGILHRGLITRCTVCTYLAFTPIEKVASSIQCQRCLAEVPLSRASWRLPVTEPDWFYDLHRTARILLLANGHVPLQLANYLHGRARYGYSDAPEFELLNSDGKSEVETDLLTLVERQLIVAEAKITNNFGVGSELRTGARKRVRAAKVFVADEIVLATSLSNWEPATVSAMKQAAAEENWPSGKAPRLRSITGLGTPNVVDQIESAASD
jgi:hypothetical protein